MRRLLPTQRLLVVGCCAVALQSMMAHSARADILYGSATTGNNSIWAIDTTSFVATQVVGNLAVAPNSLATNSAARQLYYGNSNGTTLWRLDLDTQAVTQIYDMAPLLTGLTGPTMADGGAFYNGDYYLLVQRQLPSGNVGAGNTLYRVNMSTDGLSVVGVDQFTINTPAGRSLGDLGDFAIDNNGVAYGNSWDPPGGDTQIGGYWTFNVNSPGSSFSLVQNTRPLGNNAPTYQLAFDAARSTLHGVDFFTPTRLDALTFNASSVTITPGSNLTGFTGSQFIDLSDAVITPEPASLLLCCTAAAFGGLIRRRRRTVMG